MAKRSPTEQAWSKAFRPACRRRGMRFVSGEGFLLDEVYIASVSTMVFHPAKDPDRLRLSWQFGIRSAFLRYESRSR